MLRIRPYKPADAVQLLKWFSDEESFAKWSAGKFQYPLTEQQLSAYYSKFEADENAWIFVALSNNGEVVGHFSMRNADYSNNKVHIGFIVISPFERGKGYGRELVTLALKYATEILKVKKVTLMVFDSNEAAHKLYLSLGFKDDGYDKNALEFKGESWGKYDMSYNTSL